MNGASCGRVLYTLEHILGDKTSKRRIISSNRPICLWNNLPVEEQQIDEWGRNPLYARTYPSTTESVYKASEQRYNQDEAVVASEVWDDFVKVHWPTIYEQKQIYRATTYPTIDEYDEDEESSWEEPECEDDLIALCIHA